LELYKKGFDVRLTIHDCNVIQVSRKTLREEVMEAKRISEEPFAELEGYSFPVKVEVGESWRDLKEFK